MSYFEDTINSSAIEFSKILEKAIKENDISILNNFKINESSSLAKIIEVAFKRGAVITIGLANIHNALGKKKSN